jgi:hypothetical protein
VSIGVLCGSLWRCMHGTATTELLWLAAVPSASNKSGKLPLLSSLESVSRAVEDGAVTSGRGFREPGQRDGRRCSQPPLGSAGGERASRADLRGLELVIISFVAGSKDAPRLDC